MDADVHIPASRNADDNLPAGGETLVMSPPTYHLPAEIVSCIMDTDVEGQPSNETKRSLPANTAILPYDAEQRNAHILRYITRSASDSTMDADVYVPAV